MADLPDHLGKCPFCAAVVRVTVPAGGDGSMRVCCRHGFGGGRKAKDKDYCPGSRDICMEDEVKNG